MEDQNTEDTQYEVNYQQVNDIEPKEQFTEESASYDEQDLNEQPQNYLPNEQPEDQQQEVSESDQTGLPSSTISCSCFGIEEQLGEVKRPSVSPRPLYITNGPIQVIPVERRSLQLVSILNTYHSLTFS